MPSSADRSRPEVPPRLSGRVGFKRPTVSAVVIDLTQEGDGLAIGPTEGADPIASVAIWVELDRQGRERRCGVRSRDQAVHAVEFPKPVTEHRVLDVDDGKLIPLQIGETVVVRTEVEVVGPGRVRGRWFHEFSVAYPLLADAKQSVFGDWQPCPGDA